MCDFAQCLLNVREMDKIAYLTFHLVLLACLTDSAMTQADDVAIADAENTEQRIADISNSYQLYPAECKQYSDFAFQLYQPAALPVLQSLKTVSPTETSALDEWHIVGGQLSMPREFPHMSLIGFEGTTGPDWQCGATLISDSYVLTAAHCLYSQHLGSAKYVRIGDLVINSTTDDARAIDVKIASAIAHPDYLASQNYNDIALVKIEKSIEFNRYIYPACLHSTKAIAGKTARATGWGLQEFAGSPSNHLLKVDLELFTFAKCNGSYKAMRRLPKGIDDESQLCAGSTTAERDTCQGDSGGPLQIAGENNPYIQSVIGVTSFGKSCGVPNLPAVYTRVSHFVPWIESIVWS